MRYFQAGLVLVLVLASMGMLGAATPLPWGIASAVVLGLAAGLAIAWRLARRD